MTDHRRTSALHYGHMGTATYQEGEWTFLRREPSSTPAIDTTLLPRAVTQPELVVSPSKAESSYDETTSDLLAFGYAQARAGFMQIAMCAAGDHGDAVKFLTMKTETVELDEEGAVQVPKLNDQDQAWWIGSGAPVKQIRCAETNGPSPNMAIRLASSTIILRPIFRDVATPPRYLDPSITSRRYPPSLLDANPIVTISMTKTDGCSHADVAFNPSNEWEIAIVDDRCRWSVWSIQDRKPNSLEEGRLFKATQVYGGSLLEDNENDAASAPKSRGSWATVLWIQDVDGASKLLVGACHKLVIHSFQDGIIETTDFGKALAVQKKVQSILDVRRHGKTPSQFLVLTSTDVYWLFSSRQNGRDNVSILLSVKHYLDATYTDLRMDLISQATGRQ